MSLEGYVGYKKEDAEKYTRHRWWLGLTLGDLLDKAADLYPRKECLVEGDIRLTYSQLREKTDRLAISLIKLGIKSGDRVLLQFPVWHEFVYSFFALHKIGAITTLLLPGHGAIEIGHLCKLTKAIAWMLPEKYRNIDYLPIIDEVRKSNPQLRHIILVRAKESNQFINLEKLIQNADLSEDSIKELSNRKPEPTEVAVIAPSGGTTGMPKAVPRTHNDYICGIEYKSRGLELNSFDTSIVLTPLGHHMSLNAGLLAAIFTFGKTVLLDSTRPEDFCKTVQKERVTCGPIVPTLIQRIVDFEGLKDYDLSSLIRLNVGGAPSNPDLIKKVRERIGCKFLNAYGSTEGLACQVRLDDDEETVLHTVGRPLTPYDTVKVIGPDGKELPPNTEGELVAKGPTIFSGYLNLPEENERAFTKEGFYRTGDMAIIDDKGNVRITGRIKDIIIRGGENISAIAVEELISAHPDVKEVAVVGMPDKDLGEKVCAYIVPAAGKKPTLDDIAKFMKEKGAGKLLIPERLEYIDAIPLTSTNKPDKKVLREDIKKRLGIT
jgi:2,3-dihydroxybenzoate-AMP ligase